jgi:hypothetical protein
MSVSILESFLGDLAEIDRWTLANHPIRMNANDGDETYVRVPASKECLPYSLDRP